MNAFIAISHATTTMYECKITKKDRVMKENDRIICNYLVLCLYYVKLNILTGVLILINHTHSTNTLHRRVHRHVL